MFRRIQKVHPIIVFDDSLSRIVYFTRNAKANARRYNDGRASKPNGYFLHDECVCS